MDRLTKLKKLIANDLEDLKIQIGTRDITESTRNLYFNKLVMLHNGYPGPHKIKRSIERSAERYCNFLHDHEQVLNWIDQFSASKQKALVNACMVGLSPSSKIHIPEKNRDAYDIYRNVLLEIGKVDRNNMSAQLKNKKESDNWTTMKELNRIRMVYGKDIKSRGYNTSSNWNNTKDVDTLQKWLIASLYTTQPPRRLEYGNMWRINEQQYFKLSQEMRENNNYIVTKTLNKKYFSFADVKVPDPDERIIKIPINSGLNSIIRLWFNATHCDAHDGGGSRVEMPFLLNKSGSNLTSNGLSKMLINNVFEPSGKRIGAGMIRHIFLSEKYKNDTPLKDKEELGKLMNHSAGTAELIYSKKD
jgi:hypothetical protein